MANYSLVLDTRFKPFSYQEMLAPVAAATQAHQALEEEYGNLATKASVWEEMANEQTDPYAYRMYKNYSNDLASKADQLLKYGLNPASRKDMLGMRARYSKEIVPIENAYKRREELAAEQRKARASNPTLFFQRDMASTSLDDFIRNPSLDYGANYSGALLAQQAGQIASNLKNVLTGRSKLKGIGLPYQYEQLIQYGYTPEQIQEAVTKPKEGNPILTAIVDQVLASSGMNRWATADQMIQARAYANQGLYNAIGKTDIKNFTDSYSMQNALEVAKERRADAKKRNEEEARLPYRIGDSLNTTNVEASKMAKEDLEFLRQVQRDPNMLRKSVVEAGTVYPMAGKHVLGEDKTATPSEVVYPNYTRLKQIEARYGINVSGNVKGGDIFTLRSKAFNDLISSVSTRESIGGVVNHLWIGNSTDNSWVVSGINENIRSYKAQHGKANVYKFEDGKRGDRLSSDDLDKMTSDSGTYYTFIDEHNNVRFVETYKDRDNKEQVVEVALGTVGGRDLQEKADAVKRALDTGDTKRATLEMDNIHRIIDGNANTRAMTQGKSSSDISLPAPVDYDNLGYIGSIMQ